ncbi:hypothetical protein HanRHA438_Chr01g0007131 [Helianthus annuus]|nr:hypothetical protein HanRHA438_Chr01g0007131 [Helianthus annuus]
MVTSAKMLSSLQVPINSSVLCTVLLALYITRLLCTNKLLSSGSGGVCIHTSIFVIVVEIKFNHSVHSVKDV